MLDRWQEFVRQTKDFFEAGTGAMLISVPYWYHVMTTISEIAQFITVLTGAVIGLHGVYRIFRTYAWPRRDGRGDVG